MQRLILLIFGRNKKKNLKKIHKKTHMKKRMQDNLRNSVAVNLTTKINSLTKTDL